MKKNISQINFETPLIEFLPPIFKGRTMTKRLVIEQFMQINYYSQIFHKTIDFLMNTNGIKLE